MRVLGADVRPVPAVPFDNPDNYNHQACKGKGGEKGGRKEGRGRGSEKGREGGGREQEEGGRKEERGRRDGAGGSDVQICHHYS